MIKIYIDVNSFPKEDSDIVRIQDLYRFSWFIGALKDISNIKNVEVFFLIEKDIYKTCVNENKIDFKIAVNDDIKNISKEHVLLSFDILKIIKWENNFGKGILLQNHDKKEKELLFINIKSTQEVIVNKLKNYLHIY